MQFPIQVTEKKRATTIALFTIGAIDPNSQTIWAGATAAARETGVNLICYPGRLVRSPVEYEAQRNVIYNMVDAQTVDGFGHFGRAYHLGGYSRNLHILPEILVHDLLLPRGLF